MSTASFPPVEEQLALIRRGIEKIVPAEELAKKLEWSRRTGTPLRVKYGIDPTGIDLHLGHTVPMRKMRQFQELGHQAVIIIGNATALVGDPSGRDQARARLTPEKVEANARDYLQQVGRVIDLSRAEVHRNGDWFGQMGLVEILELTSQVTVAQMLTRDDFAKRYAAQQPIYLHECLYPIMQAWDSVKIRADIELGGTEQLYSFMLARDLQRGQGLPEQVGVMSPILVGLDGVRRMGKSLGNYIGIAEAPYEMAKKFMQLSDASMPAFFELLTQLPAAETAGLILEQPKAAKQLLARTVIAEYHDQAAAAAAIERWEHEVGGGGLPADIPALTLSRAHLENGELKAVDLLALTGLVKTKSDARRLIEQGGARLGAEKTPLTSHAQLVPIQDGLIVWAGKKSFGQVKLVD